MIKQKYLKYKNKYLTLKNQKGKGLSDLPFFEEPYDYDFSSECVICFTDCGDDNREYLQYPCYQTHPTYVHKECLESYYYGTSQKSRDRECVICRNIPVGAELARLNQLIPPIVQIPPMPLQPIVHRLTRTILAQEHYNFNNNINHIDIPYRFTDYYINYGFQANGRDRNDYVHGENNYADIYTVIDENIFNGLVQLESIFITCHYLQTLPVRLFNGLLQLESINITCNRLNTLPLGLFNNLPNLEKILIQCDNINTLPVGLFNNLPNLREILIFCNNLNTLPVDLFNNLRLTRLDIDCDRLNTLPPGVFNNLVNTGELRIASNILHTLEIGLFNNPPRGFNNPAFRLGQLQLKKLKIKCPALRELHPDLFNNLLQLDSLIIENAMNIANLSQDLFIHLRNLTVFLIHHFNIQNFPINIFDPLRNLKHLYICYNRNLQNLPENIFYHLTRLESLKIYETGIVELPNNIFDNLVSLNTLDLNSNRLTVPPIHIFDNLINLRELNIGDNRFSALHRTTIQKLYDMGLLYRRSNNHFVKTSIPN